MQCKTARKQKIKILLLSTNNTENKGSEYCSY